MRIIHFSDPHSGGWFSELAGAFDKRLFGSLNYNFRRAGHFPMERLRLAVLKTLSLNPQLVVISGDVTTVGEEGEFNEISDILAPLIHSNIELMFVPGNHDAYVSTEKCTSALARAVETLNQKRVKLSDLPLVREIKNTRVLMVNEARPSGIIRSNGYLIGEELTAFKALVERPREEGELRILLGHYPCRDQFGQPLSWRRKLIGSEQVVKALDDGTLDLTLCGHIHTPFVNAYKNGMEVCAGSITKHGHLNVLDIDQVAGTISQRWVIVEWDAEVPEERTGHFEFAHLEYTASSACFLNKNRSEI